MFHRPNIWHYTPPPPVAQLEQVDTVKLLGVVLTAKLSFTEHVDQLITVLNQRLYLLNQLRRQGLDRNGLERVFHAIIISKVRYALPAFAGHLYQSDIDRIDAMFRKALRWGLTTQDITLRELIVLSDSGLFTSITNNPQHCMRVLLPSQHYAGGHVMRHRGHSFKLPRSKTSELHKSAFINRCLFTFL